MNRIALLIAIIGAGIAMPTAAAPLCHDLKGLYTPCPPAVAGHAARARAAASAHPEPSLRPERSARPERPAVITRAKRCRDLKGLFTPCPG